MSIIPSPCSFFFALHLEWSLNLSTDKNQMQFVYLRTCVPLYLVCGSDFLQVGSTFCRNAQKTGQKLTGKNFNVDRQFFKDVIRIF